MHFSAVKQSLTLCKLNLKNEYERAVAFELLHIFSTDESIRFGKFFYIPEKDPSDKTGKPPVPNPLTIRRFKRKLDLEYLEGMRMHMWMYNVSHYEYVSVILFHNLFTKFVFLILLRPYSIHTHRQRLL